MKCPNCTKTMKPVKNLRFNDSVLDGWKCSCGEVFFDPEQAQRILLLNKLKKQTIKATLGQNKNNLMLRLPKDVQEALDLHRGEQVMLKVEERKIEIIKDV